MRKSARATGITRLSDFARAALHEARRAERAGRPARAERAYDAAVALDDASFDAAGSKIGFLARERRIGEALSLLPGVLGALFSSAESRLSLASSVLVAFAFAAGAASLGSILGLFLAQIRRIAHDLKEMASRPFGQRAGTPLAFVLLALPVFLAFGPVWLILYWAALAYVYLEKRERVVLAAALFGIALVAPLLTAVAGENRLRRSPLYRAAADLAERRQDASVEDGLSSLSVLHPDDRDVWLLLAIYAERAGDYARAISAYDRAVQADPKDYRAYLNRGNVRFVEGDFAEAIGDYEEAVRRAPEAAAGFYNLAVARSEVYDFKGQEAARARAMQLSQQDVVRWSSNPSLTRVVSVKYTVSNAREQLQRRANPAVTRRRPAHSALSSRIVGVALSAWMLAPLGALALGLLLAAMRVRSGVALECVRCGRAFCRRCKRYGGPAGYCGRCVRLQARRENVSEEVRQADDANIARRVARRRWLIRGASLLMPGSHNWFGKRPGTAWTTLFTFFFAIALFAGGAWLFDVTPFAPEPSWPAGRLSAAAAALGVWLAANVSAWRHS